MTQVKVSNFLAKGGMTWKNIIPKAPWQGGIYERLIGLTKNALRRAIGRKFLAERELVTLIAEVEGILNTRPLTPILTIASLYVQLILSCLTLRSIYL
uniref:Integrase-like protein, putative n=1 Tax=Brugia malayi TaxID=6279 RepID=A8P7W3_BRUMA